MKNRGREVVRQEFGILRSYASQAKQQDNSIDEEWFFEQLYKAWLSGFKLEMNSIFGIEKTADILDLFKWRNKKT